MIPARTLLLGRLLRSAWSAAVTALLIAATLEWGLPH
jgi:hypothetical protein